MGVAVARAALDRGARVTLIAANLEVPPPAGAEVVRVGSTAELHDALVGRLDAGFDALVMAAAVADFRPTATADRKLERRAGLQLELEPTTDVLAEVAERSRAGHAPRAVLVGFAAETGSLDRAAEKLRRKGVDLLVANDVAEPGSGFGSDTNRVSILSRDGTRDDLPLLTKRAVADHVLDRVVGLLDAREVGAQTGR
jgi:phosphopantothenoylcysteine decarboxylase/phosphopantothenate--cysteine ligase